MSDTEEENTIVHIMAMSPLTAKFIGGFHFAAIYRPFQQGIRNVES